MFNFSCSSFFFFYFFPGHNHSTFLFSFTLFSSSSRLLLLLLSTIYTLLSCLCVFFFFIIHLNCFSFLVCIYHLVRFSLSACSFPHDRKKKLQKKLKFHHTVRSVQVTYFLWVSIVSLHFGVYLYICYFASSSSSFIPFASKVEKLFIIIYFFFFSLLYKYEMEWNSTDRKSTHLTHLALCAPQPLCVRYTNAFVILYLFEIFYLFYFFFCIFMVLLLLPSFLLFYFSYKISPQVSDKQTQALAYQWNLIFVIIKKKKKN